MRGKKEHRKNQKRGMNMVEEFYFERARCRTKSVYKQESEVNDNYLISKD